MKRCFIILLTFSLALNAFAFGGNADYNRYLERAKKKMTEQNYTEALDALQKALVKQPENPEIFYLLGDCNKKLRNFKESAKNYAYAKALEGRKENILIDGVLRAAKFF
jgi:cytochrome c-type biogenesis protein CcmH/NrfG